MLSTRMELTCSQCGEPIRPGTSNCPECGASYANNMHRGKIGRIDEETGVVTEYNPLAELES